MTATPCDEVDRDTYGLFGLEQGNPTYAYDLDQAINDQYLVGFKPLSVPLRFQREGIKYDDLSDEERYQRQVMTIVGNLEEKQAIPSVAKQMELILEMQRDEYWQDITPAMLESARRKLRELNG